MDCQNSSASKTQLSRDDKKIQYIEKMFRRQEEQQKRKKVRHYHRTPDSGTAESTKRKE